MMLSYTNIQWNQDHHTIIGTQIATLFVATEVHAQKVIISSVSRSGHLIES